MTKNKIIKTSEALLKKILPPQWKTHQTKIQGLKTEYFTIGKGPKKILILHGWSQSIEAQKSFLPLVETLKKNGILDTHTLYLPHYPGFGNSDYPPPSGWTTFDYATWIEAFIAEVIFLHTQDMENKITFITHSFGGRVLVRLFTQNTSQKFTPEKNILIASAGIKWPLSARQKVSVHLSQKFSRFKPYLPQEIQRFVLNRIFGARDWGAVHKNLKPTLKKVLDELDFREDLQKITPPTLLLWGAQDQVTPLKSGKIFLQYLPQANLKIFSKGTHGIHKTDPEEVGALITQFLETPTSNK